MSRHPIRSCSACVDQARSARNIGLWSAECLSRLFSAGNGRMIWRPKRCGFGVVVAASICAFLCSAQTTLALEISFRSFSSSAAIGPPADGSAAKLLSVSTVALGEAGQVSPSRVPSRPRRFPGAFKDIMDAVSTRGTPGRGGRVSTPLISQGRNSTRHGGLCTTPESRSAPTSMSTWGFYWEVYRRRRRKGHRPAPAHTRQQRKTSWRFQLWEVVNRAPATS